eukprot:1141043-Pelagomonas_calceolata.AAC.3
MISFHSRGWRGKSTLLEAKLHARLCKRQDKKNCAGTKAAAPAAAAVAGNILLQCWHHDDSHDGR